MSAAWAGEDFRSKTRFHAALAWNVKLGRTFRSQISTKLNEKRDVPEPWRRAWRLISLSEPRKFDWVDRSIAVQRELANVPLLYADVQRAMRLLSPQLSFEPNESELWGHNVPAVPERVADLTWINWRLPDRSGAAELVNALLKHVQPLLLIGPATSALHDAISLAVDACTITEDFDGLDDRIPSIEPHKRNEHLDGVIFLTELLARLLPAVSNIDAGVAQRYAEEWRAMPGRVGIRLWLHALRDARVYDSNAAIRGLLGLSRDDFWRTHRELALVVRERAGDANRDVVSELESRFLAEAQLYYDRYDIGDGQPDWRGYARDQAVWFRLKMLADAGVLSKEAADELAAIVARHPHLHREVSDRDYFRIYSSGVRLITGDATDIAEAPEADRLRVAQDSLKSHDFERQHGWRAFCDASPEGALEVLRSAPFDDVNAPLWSDLISALAYGGAMTDETRQNLTHSVFETLNAAGAQFLVLIIRALTDLYSSTPRRAQPAIAAWWPRLFQATVTADRDEVEENGDIVSQAINSPAGKLTNAVLVELDAGRKEGAPAAPALIDNLVTAASAPKHSGSLANTILIRNLGFVLSFEVGEVNDRLVAAVSGDGWKPRALRKVLVTHGPHSATATWMFRQAIFEGATSLELDEGADWAALNLLSPALDVVRRGNQAAEWGLSPVDAARALSEGSLALREGALTVMINWNRHIEERPEESWRTAVQPLIARVWPRERRFRHPRLSRHLAELAVSAGNAFPEALSQLLPYITPLQGYSSVYEIDASSAPNDYPAETLSLLWRLFGPDSQAESHDLPKLLDRLIAANQRLERDRRLQWLEQRYLRYE